MGEDEAKGLLKAAGYVVVKAETYRRLQERVRTAERNAEWEAAQTERAHHWADRAHDEQRRLAERLTFVYGEARAAGCSVEKLAGPGEKD